VDHWESKWEIQTETSAAEVLEQINNNLTTADKWVRQDAAKSNGAAKSLWRFADEKGKAWKGMLSVEPVAKEINKFIVTVKIVRSDAKAKVQMQ
jgi:hypothetical protein